LRLRLGLSGSNSLISSHSSSLNNGFAIPLFHKAFASIPIHFVRRS
jgi:hypothetical protein